MSWPVKKVSSYHKQSSRKYYTNFCEGSSRRESSISWIPRTSNPMSMRPTCVVGLRTNQPHQEKLMQIPKAPMAHSLVGDKWWQHHGVCNRGVWDPAGTQGGILVRKQRENKKNFLFFCCFLSLSRTVDLQYCASFRCTAKYFRYIYINKNYIHI